MDAGNSMGGGVATAEEVVRPEPAPMTFRANARRSAFNSLLLFGAAALVGGLVVELGFGLSVVAGFVVSLVYYAVAWAVPAAPSPTETPPKSAAAMCRSASSVSRFRMPPCVTSMRRPAKATA